MKTPTHHRRCVNFTSAESLTCKIGMTYASVSNGGLACLAHGGFCEYYQAPSIEDIQKEDAKIAEITDCLRRGISFCCKTPLDNSRVIHGGTHDGHGPRFCSKCGKISYMV